MVTEGHCDISLAFNDGRAQVFITGSDDKLVGTSKSGKSGTLMSKEVRRIAALPENLGKGARESSQSAVDFGGNLEIGWGPDRRDVELGVKRFIRIVIGSGKVHTKKKVAVNTWDGGGGDIVWRRGTGRRGDEFKPQA